MCPIQEGPFDGRVKKTPCFLVQDPEEKFMEWRKSRLTSPLAGDSMSQTLIEKEIP